MALSRRVASALTSRSLRAAPAALALARPLCPARAFSSGMPSTPNLSLVEAAQKSERSTHADTGHITVPGGEDDAAKAEDGKAGKASGDGQAAAGNPVPDDDEGLSNAEKSERSFKRAKQRYLDDMDQQEKTADEGRVAPMLFQIPAQPGRIEGRDSEIFLLWQRLLGGRRVQVVCGVDGIGKSALAAAFAEHAKSSSRFSCVQWFNGRRDLADQLTDFVHTVNGRIERNALLIFDDVADVAAATALIPRTSAEIFVVITTTGTAPPETNHLSFPPQTVATFMLGPMQGNAAADCVAAVAPGTEESAAALAADRLGGVPLLMQFAGRIATATGQPLEAVIDRAVPPPEPGQEGQLSVSRVTAGLVAVAVAHLEGRFPKAREMLETLALLNTGDINAGVAEALFPDAGADLVAAFSELGGATAEWSEDAYVIHPVVAAALRRTATTGQIAAAAKAVLAQWPRRWRSVGTGVGWSLVRHTAALRDSLLSLAPPAAETEADIDADVEAMRQCPLELVACMDRAATFLAHVEAREITLAADLWGSVAAFYRAGDVITAEAARVAMERGRILYKMGDHRAAAVLARAHDLACAAHGRDSVEAALVVVYRERFLPDSDDTLAVIRSAAQRLDLALAGDVADGVVLSAEEVEMYKQSLFVLLMALGRKSEVLGRALPEQSWQRLEALHGELRKTAAATQATRKREESQITGGDKKAPTPEPRKPKNSFA